MSTVGGNHAMVAVALVVVFGIVGLSMAVAADEVAGVGSKAPTFTLPKIDGTGDLALADVLKTGNAVLIWVSPKCPYSKACDARYQKLFEALKDKGFHVVGINSNKTEGPKDLSEYAKKVGWTFPIVYDAGAKTADAYGAQRTPEVVLVTKDGMVAYRGAIDDNVMEEGKVTRTFLMDAISALIEGKKIDPATTPAKGCSIKR